MGCCHARSFRTEENFFPVGGINFLEARHYDLEQIPQMDAILNQYIEQNFVNKSNSQDALEVESSTTALAINKVYGLDPETFLIDS